MNDLNFVFPEIFISLSFMFFLILGVYKKKSTNLVYNLSTISLIILFILVLNLFSKTEVFLFNQSYVIDRLSLTMKLLIVGSGIFVLLSSINLVNLEISLISYSFVIIISLSIGSRKSKNIFIPLIL